MNYKEVLDSVFKVTTVSSGKRFKVVRIEGDNFIVETPNGLRKFDRSKFFPINPRRASKIIDGRVVVDLDMLDLNYRPTVSTPSWKPTAEIKPYEQLTKTFLDIETDGYKLKDGVLALKLRDSRRLEIDTTKIGKMIADGESEIVKEYLNYDLDDTSLLFEFLFPIIYAQLNYVPDLNIQQLAIASPAKKAQKIHEQLLGNSATADERVKYTGGKVSLLKPGLHASVAKIDVSSLYPAIMLRYGLCSRKDTENRFLGVLECMKVERMRLKELAETGDKAAYFEQKALKILINGSYGFFGTGFYTWNDYHAAALITAYGRKILDLMVEVVEREGGTTIEIDTDGIFFSSDNPQHVYRAVTEALPDGIEIALEVSNYGMYVPKAKNYVLVSPEGKVSSKGIFIKRNRYQLEKEFPIQFIKLYFTEDPSVADEYYQEVRSSLIDGTIPVEHLTVTRKIAKNEKALVELGIGQCGERVSFWFAKRDRTGKKGKQLNPVAVQTNTDDYWSDYYVNRLDETYKLIKSTDNITKEQRIKLGIKVEPIDPESDEEIIIE